MIPDLLQKFIGNKEYFITKQLKKSNGVLSLTQRNVTSMKAEKLFLLVAIARKFRKYFVILHQAYEILYFALLTAVAINYGMPTVRYVVKLNFAEFWTYRNATITFFFF